MESCSEVVPEGIRRKLLQDGNVDTVIRITKFVFLNGYPHCVLWYWRSVKSLMMCSLSTQESLWKGNAKIPCYLNTSRRLSRRTESGRKNHATHQSIHGRNQAERIQLEYFAVCQHVDRRRNDRPPQVHKNTGWPLTTTLPKHGRPIIKFLAN